MSTFLCFPVAPASTPFLTRRSAAFSTETKRLAALHSYQVLDTPDEAAFDDLTHLASYIAGTPVALISLIDTDRQWFKARVGTEVDKIPRDQAFCHYTIQGEGPLEVPDTHLDERFLNNPPGDRQPSHPLLLRRAAYQSGRLPAGKLMRD